MVKSIAVRLLQAHQKHRASGKGMPAGGFRAWLKAQGVLAFSRRVISEWNPSIVQYTFRDGSGLDTIGRGMGHHVVLTPKKELA